MNIPTPGANGPTFRNLGIAPNLLTILDKIAFTTPTPIQEQAIAPALEGKDIVGIAQTGTGKTLAFGIPVIQGLLSDTARGPQQSASLILVPTRELALQAEETFVKVGGPLGLRPLVLIGGAPMRPQTMGLKRFPRIIIATPGRLMDHMEQKHVSLANIKFLVLDEADRMLDMGFLPSIKKILATIPTERQTLLFSATLSAEIMAIATKAMKVPLQIEIAPQGTTAENVTQEIFIVRRDDKLRLLEKVLTDHRGSTLVFTRTKHGATKVAYKIMHMGHTAAEIHSNRSLSQRRSALEGFKTGKYRVLVATDIVARGIDVKGVELVVNFDLPSQSEDYVHRIGRTARAGAAGHAISFATPEERKDIRDIERLIRKPIKMSPLPADLPGVSAVPVSSYEGSRPRTGTSSGGRSFGSQRPQRSFSKSSGYTKPSSSSRPFSKPGFSKPGFSKPGFSRSFSKPGTVPSPSPQGDRAGEKSGGRPNSDRRGFRPQRTSGGGSGGKFSGGPRKFSR